jgi:hypothetical protein
MVADYQADLDAIAAATKGNDNHVVRYASVVKSINNRMKKTQGLLDGFARKDLAAIKDAQDAEFRAWYGKQANASRQLLPDLDAAIAADMAQTNEEFFYGMATNSDLLKSARTLYRLALEKQKPDAERESGFQERDVANIKARLSRLEQSLVPTVDQARYASGLQRYAKLSGQARALDAVLPAVADVPALYQRSKLADTASRLAWMEKAPADFQQSDDPFIKLAVRMHDVAMALEDQRKEIDGTLEKIIPQYMGAVIAWKKSQGKPVYADANSTLRVTYGTVSAYSPKDGVTKGPFTTVEGIIEKHTGKDPFDAPKALLEAVKAKRYGQFKDPVLGTVPVNFLSSADTTGGNSGSAIVNKRGELIGLNFDSTYESITKDWYFDRDITRAIHLDVRYMLWVMKEVDHADNLLQEMKIKYPKK